MGLNFTMPADTETMIYIRNLLPVGVDFYDVLDVARRVAGTGSLGLDRFTILVRGKGSPDSNNMLDLKQSLPSSLLPRLKVTQPKWKVTSTRG